MVAIRIGRIQKKTRYNNDGQIKKTRYKNYESEEHFEVPEAGDGQ